ncbi:MAG: AraC family transcriptional regulator [Armatimonadetes bacterium]|nr:AraC family transcriptional regulator [Armatimonadota bacterium]
MGNDYYKWVYEAIVHIEANLDEEISLPEVAEKAGYSVFHFGRIFQGVTGETVMDYVRKRRLTEAAKALVQTNRRILDIALDWQYDSHEAFTRAFKRAYGMTPGIFRRRRVFVPLRVPLSIADIQPLGTKGAAMETRIINLPAMRVVGMAYVGKNENEEIHSMWGVFFPRIGEVQGSTHPNVSLGVCGDAREDGSFRYVAGCEVESDAPVPDGMTVFDVPAATYVVVTQRGVLSDEQHGLHAAVNYVYRDWLPQSGYQRADTPDLEWYDERFRWGQEDSEMDVYTPIVPA